MSIEKKEDLEKVSVVTGTIGVDCHVIGNWLVAYVMEQAGLMVHMLGSNVSQEEFINAAIETKSKAIVISSLGGLALLDSRELREKCEEAGLKDILMYIGGNLSPDQAEWSEIEQDFKAIGFNRVYPPDVDLQDFIKDLKADLGLSSETQLEVG